MKRYDIPNIMDILKQKLLDLFYLVEDSPRLHGIVPCQCSMRPCNNIASTFCANHMCKLCCQDSQHRLPCIIHDRYEQFFIYKIKSVYLFEETKNFDRSRTLRIHGRKLIRRYDLEKAFEGVKVEWDKLQIYYHYAAHRIQYVYLVFKTQEEAKRVLEEKHIYMLRLEKYDVSISSLNQSLYQVSQGFKGVENVLAIIKPLSTLEVVQELPTGMEYKERIVTLVQTITQLKPNDFSVELELNPVTGEPDDRHVYVILPSRAYVDKMYKAQPYFGCLVAQKLTHIQICPFLRYHPDMCLMCTSKKDPICIHDMCKDCCARQKYGVLVCKCSVQTCQAIMASRKEIVDSGKEREEDLCEKCFNKKDSNCKNKLCAACCVIQAIRVDCPTHDMSFYCKELKDKKPYELSRKMLLIVAESHIKVRYELKHGHYDWFRPVYGTNIQNEMIRANKDLQTVIDNGSLIRNASSKYRKDGKIFTFQANEPINLWVSRNEKVYESINHKGLPFIEYSYGKNIDDLNTDHAVWIKNSANKYRTYSIEDYQQFISSQHLAIRNNFHFMLIGLDRSTYTVRELYQEIYNKLSTLVGSLSVQSIMIIDNESLLTDIFNTPVFQNAKNLDENLRRLGRVACVKMDNILDSLCLLTREVKITLPLNNGIIDEPIIYPSKFMLQFLSEYNPQRTQLNIQTAGAAFAKMNKDIETMSFNIKVITEPPNEKKGSEKRKKKKKGGNPEKKVKK